MIRAIEPLAATLDKTHGGSKYTDSVRAQRDKLENADFTSSARVLADMQSESIPFFRFAMNKAIAHQKYFRERPLSPQQMQYFQEEQGLEFQMMIQSR